MSRRDDPRRTYDGYRPGKDRRLSVSSVPGREGNGDRTHRESLGKHPDILTRSLSDDGRRDRPMNLKFTAASTTIHESRQPLSHHSRTTPLLPAAGNSSEIERIKDPRKFKGSFIPIVDNIERPDRLGAGTARMAMDGTTNGTLQDLRTAQSNAFIQHLLALFLQAQLQREKTLKKEEIQSLNTQFNEKKALYPDHKDLHAQLAKRIRSYEMQLAGLTDRESQSHAEATNALKQISPELQDFLRGTLPMSIGNTVHDDNEDESKRVLITILDDVKELKRQDHLKSEQIRQLTSQLAENAPTCSAEELRKHQETTTSRFEHFEKRLQLVKSLSEKQNELIEKQNKMIQDTVTLAEKQALLATSSNSALTSQIATDLETLQIEVKDHKLKLANIGTQFVARAELKEFIDEAHEAMKEQATASSSLHKKFGPLDSRVKVSEVRLETLEQSAATERQKANLPATPMAEPKIKDVVDDKKVLELQGQLTNLHRAFSNQSASLLATQADFMHVKKGLEEIPAKDLKKNIDRLDHSIQSLDSRYNAISTQSLYKGMANFVAPFGPKIAALEAARLVLQNEVTSLKHDNVAGVSQMCKLQNRLKDIEVLDVAGSVSELRQGFEMASLARNSLEKRVAAVEVTLTTTCDSIRTNCVSNQEVCNDRQRERETREAVIAEQLEVLRTTLTALQDQIASGESPQSQNTDMTETAITETQINELRSIVNIALTRTEIPEIAYIDIASLASPIKTQERMQIKMRPFPIYGVAFEGEKTDPYKTTFHAIVKVNRTDVPEIMAIKNNQKWNGRKIRITIIDDERVDERFPQLRLLPATMAVSEPDSKPLLASLSRLHSGYHSSRLSDSVTATPSSMIAVRSSKLEAGSPVLEQPGSVKALDHEDSNVDLTIWQRPVSDKEPVVRQESGTPTHSSSRVATPTAGTMGRKRYHEDVSQRSSSGEPGPASSKRVRHSKRV